MWSSLRAPYQPEKGDKNDRTHDCRNERSDQSTRGNAKYALLVRGPFTRLGIPHATVPYNYDVVTVARGHLPYVMIRMSRRRRVLISRLTLARERSSRDRNELSGHHTLSRLRTCVCPSRGSGLKPTLSQKAMLAGAALTVIDRSPVTPAKSAVPH